MDRTIPFIKMNGAGNDFVFIAREWTTLPITASLARRLLDRHFGVGGDQLLVLNSLRVGGIPQLLIFNSDGSQAEMCGNGVRAVAAFLHREKGFREDFSILTKAGLKRIMFRPGRIEVDMGVPVLEGSKIPVKANGPIINRELRVAGRVFRIHGVSMGNPHCVIFVPKVENFPVGEIGPQIEHHPFFPRRVNVEFVQVLNRRQVRARVWERGAGETLACGSGACAIGVAAARYNKTDRKINIFLPGGRLGVRWGADDHVFLTGPTEVSFKGQYLLNSKFQVPNPK